MCDGWPQRGRTRVAQSGRFGPRRSWPGSRPPSDHDDEVEDNEDGDVDDGYGTYPFVQEGVR